MGIAVFGAVFVDIKGYPTAQFIPNGRNVGNVTTVHGGVSRNIAEDLGNIQLKPEFISIVEESGIGTDVVERLNAHGVGTSYIRKVKDGMGTWLAVFDNNGDVVASISKRPDLSELISILDDHGDEIIGSCDSVAVEIDLEEAVLSRIFSLAKKHGKKVYAAVSNMSIVMERRDYLKKLACMVCNLQEAGQLFSVELDNHTAAELVDILEMHVMNASIPSMVITLGDEGCIYISDKEVGRYPAYNVDVIDTTGAGDSFFSGVAAGLTYGKTLRESCEIGTRIASAVITTQESTCPIFRPEEFGIRIDQ